MPGVGVSYFLKYLATQNFATFFHLDLYSLPILNQHEFYKLLLTELGGEPGSKTDQELLVAVKKILKILSDKQDKLVLIFTSTKPLNGISKEPLTGGNLNFYSEELYFKPYSKEDLKKLLTIEPPRSTPKDVLDKLKYKLDFYILRCIIKMYEKNTIKS